MKENKKRLCDNPRHQQETARRYGQHHERVEMIIVTLTGERTSFSFPRRLAYVASGGTVKCSVHRLQKDTGRRDDCHGGLLFPPERGEHGLAFQLCKQKPLSSDASEAGYHERVSRVPTAACNGPSTRRRASSAALEACVPPVSVWARDLAPPADSDACWRLAYPRVDPAVLAPWLGSTRRSAATGR